MPFKNSHSFQMFEIFFDDTFLHVFLRKVQHFENTQSELYFYSQNMFSEIMKLLLQFSFANTIKIIRVTVKNDFQKTPFLVKGAGSEFIFQQFSILSKNTKPSTTSI